VLRQRFSHGLQFLASYTWAHTLDVAADSNNSGTPMNYGNSNWDIRHRFVASYVYKLPLFRSLRGILRAGLADWQINGITTLQSGLPFNVSISTVTANTSAGGTYRPNLVGAPSANLRRRTPDGLHRRRGFRDAGAVHVRRRWPQPAARSAPVRFRYLGIQEFPDGGEA